MARRGATALTAALQWGGGESAHAVEAAKAMHGDRMCQKAIRT